MKFWPLAACSLSIAVGLSQPVLAIAQNTSPPIRITEPPTRDAERNTDRSAANGPSELGTLTEQLSKGSYSSRQRATIKMWGERDQSREEVQRAARNSDPEVASRANWILRQWRRGAVPGMPARVARLLQKGDDPAAIQELVELGRFEAAVIAVEESAGSIEFDVIKERVSNAMRLRFPFYVKQAIEEETLLDLLALIDVTSSDTGMAISRIRLMDKLSIPITDENLLPASAESWSLADQQRTRAAIYTVRGRLDDAVKTAREINDGDLARNIMAIEGRWQELANEHSQLARKTQQQVSLRHWMDALAAADRCGDQAIKKRASEELQQTNQVDVEPWRMLALHGDIEIALRMIDENSPAAITDIALAASLPEFALNKLDFPIADVDDQLVIWIEAAIEDQESDLTRRSMPMQRLLCLMKILISVGRDDAAWEIADRLASANLSLFDRPLRDEVLQNLLSTGHSEWIFRLAVLDGETSVTQTGRWLASRVLPDTESPTIQYMMSALSLIQRKLTYSQRFRMACDLLNGDVPDGFDPDRDFERLFERFVDSKYMDYGRQVGTRQQTQLNHDIVAFFARHGQSELAGKCRKHLMMRGDIRAIYETGVQAADSGNADLANRYYELAWSRARSKGRSNQLLNANTDDAVLAAKATIGKWFLARRSHDHEASDRLQQEIEIMLCSPSSDFLNQVATELGERNERELAKQVYDIMLPFAALALDEDIDFYDLSRANAMLVGDDDSDEANQHVPSPVELAWRNTARKEAVRWFDLAVLHAIDSSYFRSSAFVSLPVYIQRRILESAIDDRDESTAAQSIDRIMKLDRIDIGFAEDLLPKMRDAGMGKLAYEKFDQLFERGKQHMETFPFDVTMGNNVAWVAAMNDRHLDEALELSQQTVYFEPDSAIYRDTLAEILFRLDRRQEALHVEESCLLDDPTQWHLHVQVKKYRESLDK